MSGSTLNFLLFSEMISSFSAEEISRTQPHRRLFASLERDILFLPRPLVQIELWGAFATER